MTLEDQIACVRRELGMRHAVYPKQVASRKITQDWANHQIAAMTAVLRTLEALADAHHDRGQADLFAQQETP